MDKNKLLLIIGKSKPKDMMSHMDEPDDHEESDDSEMDPGLEAAAEDLIDAVKKGDAEAVAMALKYAFECLEAHEHDEDDEGDEEDDHKDSGY